MPLSLNKLEKILGSKNLIIRKNFTVGDMAVYLEVFNPVSADSFLLYIPSKYDIPISPGSNSYKITDLEINEDGNIPKDYAGEPDDFDLEKQYQEIDLDLKPNLDKDDLKERMEENYNHPISLKDVSKKDMNELREIFRQLCRLKLCVQNVKYKVCIIYKFYL